MFDDSRALFTNSNAIFSSNFSPKGEENHLLHKKKMNFDMNDIQDYTNNKRSVYSNEISLNSQLVSHYPPLSSSSLDNSSTYRMRSLMGMDNQVSSLMMQNSSPAGFFSNLTTQSGYSEIREGVGNYKLGNGRDGDLGTTASRWKSQSSLSSGIPSSLGMLTRISEMDGGNIGPTDTKHGSINRDTQYYTSDYPLSSWNHSLHFTEKYTGLKRELDDDDTLSYSTQNGETPNHPSFLSHHLSLPKTSNDISCVDKLMQFQNSVPCKVRAKRGCATHPRSIAERVRRTRISERMRKLQELVPHMDKQTNTADMLDLAVEYIKDLQKQYKTLSNNRTNCKCYGMQKQCLD